MVAKSARSERRDGEHLLVVGARKADYELRAVRKGERKIEIEREGVME